MRHYLQEEQEEEDDDLWAEKLELELELEDSIVQSRINALAIGSNNYYNSQAWEEEEEYLFLCLFLFLFLFLFPFPEVAEVAELQVVGLDVQEDCYIVA